MILKYIENLFIPLYEDTIKIENSIEALLNNKSHRFLCEQDFLILKKELSNKVKGDLHLEQNILKVVHSTLSSEFLLTHLPFTYNKKMLLKKFFSGYHFSLACESYSDENRDLSIGNIWDIKIQCYNDNVFLFYMDFLLYDNNSIEITASSMETSNYFNKDFFYFLINNLDYTYEEIIGYSELNFDFKIESMLDYTILTKSLLNINGK